ncbi:hypothetical protein [Caldalkalibacillus salinus]|uniref:hypothetical protein n=1 Tax=Caldalkalibacillus salinus TaxID=2803787 RepID=UPI00192127F6|nr:hypothetical protein [Caldalkalibacillus salinus]
MKTNADISMDHRILTICQHVAVICHSKEFKQLNKEVRKLYKKNGVDDFKVLAFQDALFTMYMEKKQREKTSQIQSF